MILQDLIAKKIYLTTLLKICKVKENQQISSSFQQFLSLLMYYSIFEPILCGYEVISVTNNLFYGVCLHLLNTNGNNSKDFRYINILLQDQNIIISSISMPTKQMRKMEKHSMIHQTLWSTIDLWVAQHSNNSHYNFKVQTQKIRNINILIKQKTIEYLVLRKFSWIINNLDKDLIMKLNAQLKQHYEKLVLCSFLKQTNNFQILMLYLVKLTTHFLRDSFDNIIVDSALEAQMFIILYYTFLGMEITYKTYEVINRKYTFRQALDPKSSEQVQSNPKQQKPFRASKESLLDNHSKSSKKTTHLISLSRESDQFNLSRQSLFKLSKDLNRKQSLADFTALLKENLHVDPLPPLKRKKANVKDLERLNTEPAFQLQQQPSLIKQSKDDNSAYPTKKMHIFSNQLSTSLKILHPENFVFERSSKKVKYNQSFCNLNNQKIIEHQIAHIPEIKINQKQSSSHPTIQPKPGKRININDWEKIIKDLKKKVIDLKERKDQDIKISEKSKQMAKISEEQTPRTTQYQIKTNNVLDLSRTKECHRFKSEIQKEIDEDDLATTLNFKRQNSKQLTQNFSIQNYQEGSDQIPNKLKNKNKRLLTKNSLRLDKDAFTNLCSARKSEITDTQKINLHADWIINHYKE